MASKTFYLDNPKDLAAVQALLEDNAPDDISDDEDSDADPNMVVHSDHDTATENDTGDEQSDIDRELEDEDFILGIPYEYMRGCEYACASERDIVPMPTVTSEYFLGKDKKTKWNTTSEITDVSTKSQNLSNLFPGVIGEAKNAKDVYDCWALFFNNEMLENIVRYTNINISELPNKGRDRTNCNPTTVVEIKAVIGLLYGMGLLQGDRMNVQDFWASDGLGIERFPLTMAFSRFRFLLKCIRFDENKTRPLRREIDKLAAVREMLEAFNDNCKKHYSVGEYMTLDEMLVTFKGRCSFRMHIPSKRGKYGIKVFSLVDTKTFYVFNMEIDCGRQPEGPYKNVSFKSNDVVERMCMLVSGSGRNLTINNGLASCNIVRKMKDKHKITIVGGLHKTAKELPPCFSSPFNRHTYSSLFGFQDNITLVSYVPKPGKNMILLSSLHHDDKIDQSTGDKKKPVIVGFYNSTKSAVECVDEKLASYSVARKTRRWTMSVFYALLNLAAYNSYLVYKMNLPSDVEARNRRMFLKKLMFNLSEDNIKERAMSKYIPKHLRFGAQQLTGVVAEVEHDAKLGKRSRCAYCKDRKTRFTCHQCRKYLCLEHAIFVCTNCKHNNT